MLSRTGSRGPALVGREAFYPGKGRGSGAAGVAGEVGAAARRLRARFASARGDALHCDTHCAMKITAMLSIRKKYSALFKKVSCDLFS